MRTLLIGLLGLGTAVLPLRAAVVVGGGSGGPGGSATNAQPPSTTLTNLANNANKSYTNAIIAGPGISLTTNAGVVTASLAINTNAFQPASLSGTNLFANPIPFTNVIVAGSGVTLTTNSGVVTVAATGGGGTPGGGSGAVQFVEGTSFDGTNKFNYNRTNNTLLLSSASQSFGLDNSGQIMQSAANGTIALQFSTTNHFVFQSGQGDEFAFFGNGSSLRPINIGRASSLVRDVFAMAFMARPTNAATMTTGMYTNDFVYPFLDGVVGIPNGPASGRTNWLPGANLWPGREITVYDRGRTAAGTNLWITTTNSQTINGVITSTNIAANGGSLTLVSDGSGWWIKSVYP